MDITTRLKDELLGMQLERPQDLRAELAAVVRLTATDTLTPHSSVLVLDLPTKSVAQYVSQMLLHNYQVRLRTIREVAGSGRKPSHFELLIQDKVPTVIRELGLVTRSGFPIQGMPPSIVSGSVSEAESAWRGAILARGAITDPGRSSALEIVCPCPEVAMAFVGFGRRLNLACKAKETRGADRVVVRDADSVSALLTRLGAHQSRIMWDDHRVTRTAAAPNNRLANFDDANTRRSARAAEQSAARAQRALEILADDVPAHLAEAGALRVEHRQASLEELGHLADPPLTKDAIAGRIRRLFSMADKRARELGIPDTQAAVKELDDN
ncbi:DNA-binding protein WhiA [Corynebacterium sp. 13CS0277]|uniref:DNA-binding protein WhiA n=1 Tax=Corynebacterium sp. 13CS0277 TaxID=2071994 RepID=UPI001E3485ED|nr:DNA-binding protein WhiA [Corynebacterium sp. 13CS0277]